MGEEGEENGIIEQLFGGVLLAYVFLSVTIHSSKSVYYSDVICA